MASSSPLPDDIFAGFNKGDTFTREIFRVFRTDYFYYLIEILVLTGGLHKRDDSVDLGWLVGALFTALHY